MQNGSLSLGTVSDIKKHAKSFAEQISKGYSAKTLIGSARSQIQRGQSADAAGHPKEALRAFYIAVTLASKCIDSKGGPSNEGSRSNCEFLQFYQENMTSIVDRIKTLEAELLDLERSSAAEFPHQGERPNGKLGTLVADRLKMLDQNGVVDPVAKRYSRKLPARIALSASLSDTARLYRTLASLSTPSSASSSATTLPHAIVPPFPINLHSQAIDMKPTEPSYLTNRAASYMASKRFRLALSDCQQAATLQSAEPSSKTLLCLARCQLALGLSEPALTTLRSVLALEPANTAAVQLNHKVLELEAHLRSFEAARKRSDWGMACLALDKCLQSIDAEGAEVPSQWRLWRVELELSQGNWDGANTAANDTLRLEPNSPEVLALCGLVLFLSGKLPQALRHVASALRLNPGHEPARRLRKRVKDVERLKEEGNTAFKGGRHQEAIDRYTGALDRIGQVNEEGKGGQIRATLLSNRATTLVKLERYEDALVDAEASLALCSTSFKALRTRARINLHLEKYDAAIADFRSSIEHAGFEGLDAEVGALKVELKNAEAVLKRSKTKDYYKILGLARDCGDDEIKKAYRRESLKHHPDKGGDEENFKLVAEARAVLSDPQRRERYDDMG